MTNQYERAIARQNEALKFELWNEALELAARMAEDKGLIGMAKLAYEIRMKKK